MGTITGTLAAAFMVMVLGDDHQRSNILCPEDWAEPDIFYKALGGVGVPKDEIVETT